MSDKARYLRCIYRISLLASRDAEGNKRLINKLKRIIRKLEAVQWAALFNFSILILIRGDDTNAQYIFFHRHPWYVYYV